MKCLYIDLAQALIFNKNSLNRATMYNMKKLINLAQDNGENMRIDIILLL